MTETNDTSGEREIEIESDRERSDGVRPSSERPPSGFDSPSTSTPADRLGDELGRIDVLTTPEGYVEGRVTAIESVDATTVELTVALPHGEIVSFDLEKPIPWSSEFLLARIVEDVGYDASSIGHLVGEPVYLVRTDVGEEVAGSSDWWTLSVRAAGNAVLSSVSDRLRLEEDRAPEWRLVDPLERPAPADDGFSAEAGPTLALALALLGPIVAAIGAVIGVTGGVVLSSAVVAAVLAGLALTLLGLAIRSALAQKT